jgi:hypothetical protein
VSPPDSVAILQARIVGAVARDSPHSPAAAGPVSALPEPASPPAASVGTELKRAEITRLLNPKDEARRREARARVDEVCQSVIDLAAELTAALEDDDVEVRAAAAEALRMIGKTARDVEPKVVSALMALKKDRENMRRAAAEALKKLDPRALSR